MLQPPRAPARAAPRSGRPWLWPDWSCPDSCPGRFPSVLARPADPGSRAPLLGPPGRRPGDLETPRAQRPRPWMRVWGSDPERVAPAGRLSPAAAPEPGRPLRPGWRWSARLRLRVRLWTSARGGGESGAGDPPALETPRPGAAGRAGGGCREVEGEPGRAPGSRGRGVGEGPLHGMWRRGQGDEP